jgi:hypothetical protein
MHRSFGRLPAYEMSWNCSRVANFLISGRAYGWGHVGCRMAEWQLDKSSFTGSTRDQRAGLGRVSAATRNTSLYSDQLLLFAGLLSSLAPQSPISLRQSPQLDNGSDVVLLEIAGDCTNGRDVDETRKSQPVTAALMDLLKPQRADLAISVTRSPCCA